MIRRTLYGLWAVASGTAAGALADLAHGAGERGADDVRAVFLTLAAVNALACGVVAWWAVQPAEEGPTRG